MSSGSPLRVLACGDVRGRFSVFLKRLNTIVGKSGPFEMVLCVGSFFGDAPTQVDVDLWDDIKTGKTSLPLPVYILGPNSREETSKYADLGGYEIAENLVYLGPAGCFTTKEGLKIAYFSGSGRAGAEDTFGLNHDRVKSLEVSSKCQDSNFVGVDVLITSEWPRGVTRFAGKPEDLPDEAGAGIISKLAVNLRPRYHFAGTYGCHFERKPYRNHRVIIILFKNVFFSSKLSFKKY